MALNDQLECVICSGVGYMAEPTHIDPHGFLVFCCYTCRQYRRSTIEHRKYVKIDDWMAAEQRTSNSTQSTDWDEVTPAGGIALDPKFKP